MFLGTFSFLFFLSGACSLVYETLWIRILSLGVGSTSAAMSLVLAIFFAGLSLGSWLCGKYIKSPAQSMRWYAMLEAGIGIYGLLIFFPLSHFHSLLSLFPFVGGWAWLGHLSKFALCALFLTLPTLAMGATLPLLVNAFESKTRAKTKVVSYLYALNTFGAAAGTLAASFFLIPQLGLSGANYIAAAFNIAISLGALALIRTLPKTQEEATPVASHSTAPLSRSLLLVSAACGFASISSEVVWNKYLGIFLGNNIYGLGLVLSLYLLGIGLGAILFNSKVGALAKPSSLLLKLLCVAVFLTAVTGFIFNWLPAGSILLGYLSGTSKSLLLIKCLLVGVAVLPVTLVFGALFPLVIHLLKQNREDGARIVSLVYAVNTVGAILGSYFAGLWLIPYLGSTNTIRIAGTALVAATIYLFSQEKEQPTKRWVAIGAVGLLAVFTPKIDFSNILKSAYLQRVEPQALTQTMKYFEKGYEEFVWIAEGETSIISLSRDPKDGASYKEYLRLKTNGLNESVYHKGNLSTLPRYEALLGLVPYLFSHTPEKAFIVGYGGGYTVDLLTSLPIKKVHVVELENAILEAAQVVHNKRNPLLHRQNLDLSVEDARFVLATKMHAPLDIIVSQPSHSWLAGAANLFTKDFFEIVKGNLSERGVFAQWLNLYNMDDVTLKSILATFYGVFPNGAVFSGENDQEMILLGSESPLEFNSELSRRIETNPMLVRKLVDVPFKTGADLFAHFALSRDEVVALTAGSPTNTDNNAFAETRQSKLFYRGVPASASPQAFLTRHYGADFKSALAKDTELEFRILTSQQQSGQHQKFFHLLAKFEEKHRDNPKAWAQLGYLCLKAQRYESGLIYLNKAFQQKAETNTMNLILSAMVETGRQKQAVALFEKNAKLRDRISECYALNAYLVTQREATANTLAAKLVNDVSGYTQACGDYFNRIIGDYYFDKKEYRVALPFYEAYYQAFSQDVGVLKKMAAAYLAQNDWSNAKQFSDYLPSVVAGEKKQLESLVNFYEGKKLHADAKALQAKVEQMGQTSETF